MVGRITQGKGAILFARAARALGSDALFVGDGPCAPEVVKLYNRARVTGWASREKVTDYLKTARVLVFPSLWYETEGLSVIEAAALGVPSIVADTSAARMSIVDGVTGLCFAGADEADLSRTMRTLSADDALVGTMGQAAYQRYWENPRTLDRHVSELEVVYEQVLRRRI
jgi:glycosyltransferase involved in cell wall biosynthesis